jgi:UDP-N-acetylglucosamine--N-acetylmuramyl-(pentapeptide) pyrophosphoryl-undecaprenol N-acetylglucosamine transferase
LVPKHGVPFCGIVTKGFGPHGVKEVVAGTHAVIRGMLQANRLLRLNHVEAVVGTGGYAGASVVLAAGLRRMPVVLHEPNAVAGKANRWLSLFAGRVSLGFQEGAALLPSHKCVVTGVAVRTPAVPDRAEARLRCGLSEERPTLLVVGGSQGAVALNESTMAALDGIERMGFQVLHQTGPKHFEGRSRAEMARRPWYRAVPYIEDMTAAYVAADVAVCRAGASTVAEVALYGLPTIFVPFPHAADDHQRANAGIYERAGAARMLEQAELSSEALCAQVATLAQPGQRDAMRQRLKAFARPNAADDVARLALALAGHDQGGLLSSEAERVLS